MNEIRLEGLASDRNNNEGIKYKEYNSEMKNDYSSNQKFIDQRNSFYLSNSKAFENV